MMSIDECVKNTNDYELMMLYEENDEDAKNLLYAKYTPVIFIIINKYIKHIKFLEVDYYEAYDECVLGFCDAINHYTDDKNASLATFITLCVERRLNTLLKKYRTLKNKLLNDTYSLEGIYDVFKLPLIEILGDKKYEPLSKMTEKEKYDELIKNIELTLSKGEKDVFRLMAIGLNYQQISEILNRTPKQIDNTMQRIKNKLKELE